MTHSARSKGPKTVGLLTDFGTRSQYVAEIKALLLSELPDVKLVDISHKVGRQNVEEGAFLLFAASRWFPAGSVFVGVVDPGVGTGRKGLVIKTQKHHYIGPDNGLLSPSAHADGSFEAFALDESKFPRASDVFHGRDIFARAAAHVLKGRDLREIAKKTETMVELDLFEVETGVQHVRGRVLFVDDFGNVVTNIRDVPFLKGLVHGKRVGVRVDGRYVGEALCTDAYGKAPEGQLVLLRGSELFLELAVNLGNAADISGAKIGSRVELTAVG